MKHTVKRSKFIVISLCGLAFAASLFGGAMFANDSFVSANAADSISVDTNGVATSGFEMTAGASIKVVEGENGGTGIRWETNVSDDFITYLTKLDGYQSHSFHTLATGVNMLPENGTIADVTPDLKKSDNKPACKTLNGTLENGTYYGSIVYGGEEWATVDEENKLAYYQTELIARAYVKVVKTDNSEAIIYAKADDTRRSMHAVAAEHQITGGTEDVSSYLGSTVKDVEQTMVAYYDGEKVVDISAEVPEGKYLAYAGAKKIGVATVNENGTATLNREGCDAEKGKVCNLNLFDENNNLYSVDFVNPTGIITEFEDLQIFNLQSYPTEKAATTLTYKTIDGYYVLGKNIDGTGKKLTTQGYIDSTHRGASMMQAGFRGTFDGRGYTISNLTFGDSEEDSVIESAQSDNLKKYTYSLFGLLGEGAVVKNVAITDVKYQYY